MLIPAIYGEDYENHWVGIDWRSKTVLDIGADVGSTADYFLSKGASLVYAVEGNYLFYRKLEENARKRGGIVPILMFIESPNQIRFLLDRYKPDVVKMDCERCEKCLISVPDHVVCNVPEYIIETHTENLFRQIVQKMHRNFDISFFDYLNKVKIIIAQR